MRARVDEEVFLAKAMLTHAASINNIPNALNTYAEAVATTEAVEWRQAIDEELLSFANNMTWTLVTRGPAIGKIRFH